MSTLKVDTILKRTGTGTITVGQSGDTITIPSGATLNSAGTNTLEGIANTPAFLAQKPNSSQSISQDSTTKVTFTDEIYDSDGTYDTSNSRFTPGVAGKYCISAQVGFENMSDAKYVQVYLYVNGSELNSRSMGLNVNGADTTQDLFFNFTYTVNASATDYYEIYARQNNGNSRDTTKQQQVYFQAYRILGA
jgi:hypothetical protein